MHLELYFDLLVQDLHGSKTYVYTLMEHLKGDQDNDDALNVAGVNEQSHDDPTFFFPTVQ